MKMLVVCIFVLMRFHEDNATQSSWSERERLGSERDEYCSCYLRKGESDT